jgi:hypothetical protein
MVLRRVIRPRKTVLQFNKKHWTLFWVTETFVWTTPAWLRNNRQNCIAVVPAPRILRAHPDISFFQVKRKVIAGVDGPQVAGRQSAMMNTGNLPLLT